MKIFTGSASKSLADNIAENLNVKLSQMELSVFPDGEKRIKLNEKVVAEDVVIVQSTSIPTDSNYMELFFIIDALKRSGAKSITAVIAYFGYSRQDHLFREGEDVSLEVIIKILETTGMGKIITVDLHSIKTPNLFSVPIFHLSAISLFAQKINELKLENYVLVSPDMGGIRRIKQISEILNNKSFVTIDKNRNVETGKINDTILNGDVKGKIAIIVDDIISSGETLIKATDILLENGADRVYAFITHAVLANNAPNLLQNSRIEKIFVTDTIEIDKEKRFDKLEIISVSDLIANSLK